MAQPAAEAVDVESGLSSPWEFGRAVPASPSAGPTRRSPGASSQIGTHPRWVSWVTLRRRMAAVRQRLAASRVCALRSAAAAFCIVTLIWFQNLFVTLMPSLERIASEPGPGQEPDQSDSVTTCWGTDNQLRQDALLLFVYYSLFLLARVPVFIPVLARRVVQFQNGAYGTCAMFTTHFGLYGPLYVFGLGSALFWAELSRSSSECQQGQVDFYAKLQLFDVLNIVAFAVSCVFLVLHGAHLRRRYTSAPEEDKRAVPPGTIDLIRTCQYDPDTFGDENGKQFPSECPICLAEWSFEDVIKVPPCGHAFHEECLGRWLVNDRTCAMCRRDVTITEAVAVPCPVVLGSVASSQRPPETAEPAIDDLLPGNRPGCEQHEGPGDLLEVTSCAAESQPC